LVRTLSTDREVQRSLPASTWMPGGKQNGDEFLHPTSPCAHPGIIRTIIRNLGENRNHTWISSCLRSPELVTNSLSLDLTTAIMPPEKLDLSSQSSPSFNSSAFRDRSPWFHAPRSKCRMPPAPMSTHRKQGPLPRPSVGIPHQGSRDSGRRDVRSWARPEAMFTVRGHRAIQMKMPEGIIVRRDTAASLPRFGV
jgi:hypothetical protein